MQDFLLLQRDSGSFEIGKKLLGNGRGFNGGENDQLFSFVLRPAFHKSGEQTVFAFKTAVHAHGIEHRCLGDTHTLQSQKDIFFIVQLRYYDDKQIHLILLTLGGQPLR
ncbi:hypothetical protein SDC9_100100 [bioreactor metagenome]|uniref:Uncharacterized protein n=1 Tax=bioreactor metagenome TaxID=1076179 RepID=A0A645AR51_9ZZZZ